MTERGDGNPVTCDSAVVMASLLTELKVRWHELLGCEAANERSIATTVHFVPPFDFSRALQVTELVAGGY